MTNLCDILENQQETILQIYLQETSLLEREILKQFLPFSHLDNLVETFFELSKDNQIIIANHLARIADIQFRTRNVINSKFAHHIANLSPFDAYSFEFTLQKLCEKNISSRQIQKLINQNIISHSITAHPTNPYSTNYTIQSMNLDRILSQGNQEGIKKQIAKMIKINPVPLVKDQNQGKKTQKDEVFEAISYMKNIYYSLPIARRNLQESLKKFGFGDVKIEKFYELCVWLSGDGDGNSSATAQALQENINIFKEEILKLYERDLQEIQGFLKSGSQDPSFCWDDTTSEKLIADLKQLPKSQKIEDLIYRIENFGFHFAKIDLRHSADDIEIAAQEVAKIAQTNSQEILKNLKNETSKRVFSRLLIVAENPEVFDKFIISECKSSWDVLNVMFLLKSSNCQPLNIVTLSESADDLLNLDKNIEELLENETYKNHLISKGKLYYMIAKSDTQRRDGVGSHFAQELAVEKVTKIFSTVENIFLKLRNIKLIPFNGGGHALQRGGGRIDEIPCVYAKSAMRGIFWNNFKINPITILPPVLTTQGHQNGILFSASNTNNFLTSYFSQSILASAKMVGILNDDEILNPDGLPNQEAVLARKNRELFFHAAGENYHREISDPLSPINILFKKSPWASVELSNVSSRPSKRVENSDLQLIDQRAIGVERLCAHSATHLISWYSSHAGLTKIINEKGFDETRRMYLNDKSTRDSFRSMIMSLAMTDFEISWKMMIGKDRPDLKTIDLLATKYRDENFKKLSEKEQNQITLAHIEVEAIKTANLIHKIIVNDDNSSNLSLQNLFGKLWKNLAIRISHREEKLKFAHLLEAKIIFDLPEAEKRYPKDLKTKQLIRAINAACTGSEAPNITMLRSTNRDFLGSFEENINSDLKEILQIIK
jgi:phosphoenolpyruvate carboxylase